MSFVAKKTLGRGYPDSQPKSRKVAVSPHSRVYPVQTRTAPRPARFLSPPSVLRQTGLPLPGVYPDAVYTFDFTVSPRVDFVQDPYPEELKVCKPVPKVSRPASSIVLNLNSHSRPRPSS